MCVDVGDTWGRVGRRKVGSEGGEEVVEVEGEGEGTGKKRAIPEGRSLGLIDLP